MALAYNVLVSTHFEVAPLRSQRGKRAARESAAALLTGRLWSLQLEPQVQRLDPHPFKFVVCIWGFLLDLSSHKQNIFFDFSMVGFVISRTL